MLTDGISQDIELESVEFYLRDYLEMSNLLLLTQEGRYCMITADLYHSLQVYVFLTLGKVPVLQEAPV